MMNKIFLGLAFGIVGLAVVAVVALALFSAGAILLDIIGVI